MMLNFGVAVAPFNFLEISSPKLAAFWLLMNCVERRSGVNVCSQPYRKTRGRQAGRQANLYVCCIFSPKYIQKPILVHILNFYTITAHLMLFILHFFIPIILSAAQNFTVPQYRISLPQERSTEELTGRSAAEFISPG